MATPLLSSRQPDTVGVLGLAINTCAEQNGREEEVDRIRDLLVARDLWETVPGLEARPRRAEATGDAPDLPPAPPYRRHRGGDERCLTEQQRA